MISLFPKVIRLCSEFHLKIAYESAAVSQFNSFRAGVTLTSSEAGNFFFFLIVRLIHLQIPPHDRYWPHKIKSIGRGLIFYI